MLLKGIKVLDLTSLLPGPMCSLLLADLGAEVIKIENLSGDAMRYFEASEKTGKSPFFLALNRNKKSIALNLKSKEGRKIFTELSKNADVIIEGFRPGKADMLGIGYNEIKKINPKIIYCSITGYGQESAYKGRAGHDINYISLSGMLDLMSDVPFVPGIQIADAAGAFAAAFSILSALLYREKSGKGNYIDVPIFGSALSMIGMHLAHRSSSPKNKKTILSGAMPCYNIYETKDRMHVSLGAIEPKFWEAFCDAAERKDLIKSQFDRSDAVLDGVRRIFSSKTMKEWNELNNKFDFCCEPVKKIEEAAESDEHFFQLDGIKELSMPVKFSSANKTRHSKSPALGEHTISMLRKIGYTSKKILELKNKKIIA